ncbi:ABC transporter permease, partial [Trichothermofontia sp.]
MTSIARRNLFEDLPRFLIAQAGITFAVSLITIQAGILQGFSRSTALLIEQSKADLWIASDQMEHLELTEPLPLSMVDQAAAVTGVQRAEALMLGSGRWYSGHTSPDTVRIFGFDPQGTLFVPGTVIAGSLEALSAPYTVLVDRSNLRSLNITGVGTTARIRSLPVKVVGITQGTQSIAASAFVFASLPTAKAYSTAGLTSELNCQIRDGNLQCTNVYQPSAKTSPVAPTQPLP